jgi:hypothetical protein
MQRWRGGETQGWGKGGSTFGLRVRVEKEADGAWTMAAGGGVDGGDGGAGDRVGSSSMASATRCHAAAGTAMGAFCAMRGSPASIMLGRARRRLSCSGVRRVSEEEVELAMRFLRRPAMARSSSISSAEASSRDRLWHLPLPKSCESVALWAWIERMNEISSSSDRRHPCGPYDMVSISAAS